MRNARTGGEPSACQSYTRLSQLAAAAIGLFLFLGSLTCLSSTAQAARVRPLIFSEKLAVSGKGNPFFLAVDQETRHFYVTNGNENGGERRVSNLEANGQIDLAHPELTGQPPSLDPLYVAVDNSGGAHEGYIYATGGSALSGRFVQQFDATGQATAVQIAESAIPANGTAQGGGLPPVVNSGSFHPGAVAVDGAGDLFVIDATVDNETSAKAIDVFDPAGNFVKQLAAGHITGGTRGLAIDAAGDIYLANDSNEGLGQGLFELDPSGECAQVGCTPIDPAPIEGVAIDQAGGKIFTSGQRMEEGSIAEYEATTHQLLGITHSQQLHEPLGIGVDEAGGEVIVADLKPPLEGTIQIYGPVEIVPDVETLPPEGVTDNSAILKGTVGAAGVAGATCAFQYVNAEEFKAHRFEGTPGAPAPTAPCQPEGPFSGSTTEAVEAKVEGLRGGTTYHERLLGTNANGSNAGEDISFTTLGPTVTGTEALEVTGTAATLTGMVNPRGATTTYRFEYLPQARFEESGWATATEAPPGGEPIGSGTAPVEVEQRIEGLSAGIAYRMRIRAIGVGGPTAGEALGEEVEFSTYRPPSAGLPDGRRYEQVSPVAKNGGNVQGAVNAVQASLDGDRVTFFANTGVPGGEGAQQFPTFMASRAPDASGWSTQGLLPPASYGQRATVLGWDEDLTDTYDWATPAFGTGSLLVRSSGGGSLTEAGSIDSPTNPLFFAGSSQEGKVALLESQGGGLVHGDLEGKQNVYAYNRATNELVVAGVLNPATPGGEPAVPPGGAMAGPYDWADQQPSTTAGGARMRYPTQPEHAISADGSKVFFTAAGTGQLYVRENPLAAQSAMSGEECTETAKACTIRVSAPEEGVSDPGTPAAFVGASVDGQVVFFLDKGKLTADATGGAGYDLYRYDLQSGELTDLTLDAADKAGARVEGVLGIGAGGRDVYFVAAGALAPEATQAPRGETNLYLVEKNTIHLITRLGESPEEEMSNSEEELSNSEEEEFNWIPVPPSLKGASTDTSRVSTDGRTLLFRSSLPLTAYRNHGVFELYLYHVGEGISCISCNPTGEAPRGNAGVQEIPALGVSVGRTYAFVTRNLSADGRRVIFDSPDRLVAADENDVNDVYEWEEPGKGSCTEGLASYVASSGGCLFLISGGAKGAGPSYLGDVDEEGENVFFFTAQPLVPQDKDELVDVYDARVGGGIASQEVLAEVPCRTEGECAPPPRGEPSVPSPRSSTASGPNVAPPKTPSKPCRRGLVRKGGKCVRKSKDHHAKARHQGKTKKHGKRGGR